jgi:hypothetical protein
MGFANGDRGSTPRTPNSTTLLLGESPSPDAIFSAQLVVSSVVVLGVDTQHKALGYAKPIGSYLWIERTHSFANTPLIAAQAPLATARTSH